MCRHTCNCNSKTTAKIWICQRWSRTSRAVPEIVHMVDNFACFFDCTMVSRVSDRKSAPSSICLQRFARDVCSLWSGLTWPNVVFLCSGLTEIDPSTSFHCRFMFIYVLIWCVGSYEDRIYICNFELYYNSERGFDRVKPVYITKTRLFKYIENITTKNWKGSDKNSTFFIFLLKT